MTVRVLFGALVLSFLGTPFLTAVLTMALTLWAFDSAHTADRRNLDAS